MPKLYLVAIAARALGVRCSSFTATANDARGSESGRLLPLPPVAPLPPPPLLLVVAVAALACVASRRGAPPNKEPEESTYNYLYKEARAHHVQREVSVWVRTRSYYVGFLLKSREERQGCGAFLPRAHAIDGSARQRRPR